MSEAPHEVVLPLMGLSLTLTASYVLLPYAHARAIPHKLVILILNQTGLIDQSILPSCLQARLLSTTLSAML